MKSHVPTLWLVIPVYNEESTLAQVLGRVAAVDLMPGWVARCVIVDDGSADGSFAIAQQSELMKGPVTFCVLRHGSNRGKGAAVRTGFRHVLASPLASQEDAVVIQDADLEYEPADLRVLMTRLEENRCDAVFGSRFLGRAAASTVSGCIHAWGNALLTRVSNRCTGLRLTDMESCYKMIRMPMLRRLVPLLTEDRFGIEPQITAGLARLDARVSEVPIRYEPRSAGEGKKIKWSDGPAALWVIIRETMRTDIPEAPHEQRQ